MQINTLHQNPGVIGQDEVLPQAGKHFAVPLADLLLVGQPINALVVLNHGVRQTDTGHEEHVLEQRHEGAHHERGEQVHVQYVSRASQFPTSDGRQT